MKTRRNLTFNPKRMEEIKNRAKQCNLNFSEYIDELDRSFGNCFVILYNANGKSIWNEDFKKRNPEIVRIMHDMFGVK